MLDPNLIPRFLLLVHAVGVTGLAAWYLGVIPRGPPERRFLPLGIYMVLTIVTSLTGWLAGFENYASMIRPWVNVVGTVGGVIALVWAHRVAVSPGDREDNYPWSLKLSLLLHLSCTYLIPRVFEIAGRPIPESGLTLTAIGALLWLIFSQIGRLRRKGHNLHWSMAVGVIVCLALGWVLVKKVHDQGWQRVEEDMVRQVSVLSESFSYAPLAPTVFDEEAADSLEASLRSACEESSVISGAFILRTDGRSSEFLVTTFDSGKTPTPHFRKASTYAHAVNLNGPAIDIYRESSGGEWITVMSPIEIKSVHGGVGALGFITSSEMIQRDQASAMLATESILLLVAMVIYICIAGYLHGLERVWQRDALLEASAIVAQRLLHTSSTHDIASWLVNHLHEQLHLVHTSFLLHSRRDGQDGFRLLGAQPIPSPAHPWYPSSAVSSYWANALAQGDRIEGGLRELGPPVPGFFPDHIGSSWLISESIVFRDRHWGSLTLVFPEGSRAIRSEIRSALQSMATAFAFCLAREERSEHLAAAEERLRTIIDTSPDGFWDADFVQNRHYRSPQWWQILGYEAPASNASQEFEAYIEPEDLLLLKADAREPLPPGRHFRRRQYRARHLDGSWRWIETNTVEIRTRHGAAERALGFDRDVTERQQYEERLRGAAETAARANQAKSEFLATMSHELRTPLNSVIGFASILDRSALNATQRDWVSSMRTSAEQLLGLISDVLDFSRIEAGKLDLEIAPFELRRAAEQALEHFSRLATDKHIAIHLHFQSSERPTWVLGDVLRLRQIITNLVGNAVKFTDEGHVTLAVTSVGDDRWEFAIEDTGPGIPPELIPSLFDRFSQLDPSTTRKHGGTGLGLAISRQLARSMRGDIVVSSEVGVGSRFVLTAVLPITPGKTRRFTDRSLEITRQIPVLHPDENDLRSLNLSLHDSKCEFIPFAQVSPLIDYIKNATAPVCVLFPQAFRPAIYETARQLRELFGQHAPPVQLVGLQPPAPEPTQTSPFDVELAAPLRRRELISIIAQITVESSAPFDTSQSTQVPFENPTPPAANDLRVLVAEDHPVNREVIGTMLEQLKVPTDFAENGAVAIELLSQFSYDLALIDIQMPVVDGYGVVEWVRSSWHGRWPPPRMVAVTANATRGDRQRCLDAGMDDFMPKPITFTTLADTINELRPDSRSSASSPAPMTPPSVPPTPPDNSGSGAGDLLIDWASFESILGFTNAHEEPEVLRRIIATYEQDCTKILDQVAAMTPEEHGESRKLLHKLKGSSGSLAFAGAMSSIKKLHDPMESPPAEERAVLLAQIRTETTQCIASVRGRYPWLNVDQA